MPHPLYFKKRFHAAIREGRKTSTLRRWSSPRAKAGERIFSPGVGWLLVDAVDLVRWTALTESDARADGFASLKELSRTIKAIYPNLRGDGKAFYRLRFRLEEAVDAPAPRAAKGKVRAKRRRMPLPAMDAHLPDARLHLATAIRAELDKAVRGNGSLPTL